MSTSVNPLILSGVIGDVVDNFQSSVRMFVKYGPMNVANASEFYPSIATDPPTIQIGGDRNEFFTLVMTDPDAPSPSEPSMRELVHWIVVNIPGGTNPTRGREIVPYAGPRPHLGIHRYIFLLFKQRGLLHGVQQPETRQNFSTRRFSNYFGLGRPVAAIYFNARRVPASLRGR